VSVLAPDVVTYISGDSGVPVFGRKGCSVHVREILRAFSRGGTQLRLIARRLGGSRPEDLADVEVLRLAPTGVRDGESHGAVEGWNSAIDAVLHHQTSPDLVYERHSIWSWRPMEWAASHDTPSILEVNAPLIEEQARYRGLEDRNAAERATRRAFEAAETVVAVSERVADYAHSYGARTGHIRVVENGVDPARFEARRAVREGAERRGFTVGFVGTLKPWHGLSLLADAFADLLRTHPDARLLVVGDGPARSQFERALAERGALRSTDFIGSVDPEAIPSLLDRMDVGVAPYPAQDPSDFYFSPLKILEYMAAGLPIVASAIGQIPSLVEHGREGLLSPPGDRADLARALRRLADSPRLRRRLGRAGRARAVRRHSWDAVLERTLAPIDAGVTV